MIIQLLKQMLRVFKLFVILYLEVIYMYKQILIISEIEINNNLLKDFDYLQIPSIKLLKTYQGIYNDNIIDFDYLIMTSKIDKKIMSEDGFVLTNIFFETNVDNYFAIGKCIRSTKSIDEQLNTVIDYIKGN